MVISYFKGNFVRCFMDFLQLDHNYPIHAKKAAHNLWIASYLHMSYSGILPCFLAGLSSRLLFKVSKFEIIYLRVAAG